MVTKKAITKRTYNIFNNWSREKSESILYFHNNFKGDYYAYLIFKHISTYYTVLAIYFVALMGQAVCILCALLRQQQHKNNLGNKKDKVININFCKAHIPSANAYKIIHQHLFIRIYASQRNTLKIFLYRLLDYALSPILSQYSADERNPIQSARNQLSIEGTLPEKRQFKGTSTILANFIMEAALHLKY